MCLSCRSLLPFSCVVFCGAGHTPVLLVVGVAPHNQRMDQASGVPEPCAAAGTWGRAGGLCKRTDGATLPAHMSHRSPPGSARLRCHEHGSTMVHTNKLHTSCTCTKWLVWWLACLQECLYMQHGQEIVFLRSRKGFIRMAMQTGCSGEAGARALCLRRCWSCDQHALYRESQPWSWFAACLQHNPQQEHAAKLPVLSTPDLCMCLGLQSYLCMRLARMAPTCGKGRGHPGCRKHPWPSSLGGWVSNGVRVQGVDSRRTGEEGCTAQGCQVDGSAHKWRLGEHHLHDAALAPMPIHTYDHPAVSCERCPGKGAHSFLLQLLCNPTPYAILQPTPRCGAHAAAGALGHHGPPALPHAGGAGQTAGGPPP